MKLKISIIFPLLAVTLLLIGCQSEVNSPDRNELLNDQLSYETVDSDLALMKDGGMPLDSAAGVFSIGWNEIFRPFMDSSRIKGMAFAVAFGERPTDLPHFRKFGLDMGEIFINYSGNHIEMHKRFHERRGTAYSLFKRPFGNSENLLEYIPNTEYQFEVTGSEFFAPITISLTSPNALMDITSPANGQVIDPTQDLTINWEGGKEGKVGVRLMPHLRPHRGPGGGPGRMEENHPPFDKIIFVILDTNTGTYTFSAEQIQILLNGIQADGLMSEVSQMDFGEVEHENGTLRTAMRNGNSVMMRIQ
ncbi:MAG: hypothetical protein MUE91_05280 [Ignavibacteriaceae bacterium]|jgi:hypothetical protein|nr:hypothetical protein [Ignavibacteriaceae bacterium]